VSHSQNNSRFYWNRSHDVMFAVILCIIFFCDSVLNPVFRLLPVSKNRVVLLVII